MLKNILIALDQLANTLLGGLPDETISARAYRNKDKSPRWMAFINWLFNDQNHCHDSYLSERHQVQLPAVYRKGKRKCQP